ncbi:MAG: hypothetical protein C4547_16680 [Phycisphaerales bacterium]|nr:MAG: hypothetical protein C4547_16680 [Phycisphaerales bacterium]
MAESLTPADRRALTTVWVGLLIQLVTVAGLALVASNFGSPLMAGAARFAGIGVPIWFALLLIFRQRRRVLAEQLEAAELRRARAAGDDPALFEVDEEEFMIERRKLETLARWALPIVTALLSVALIAGNWIGWSWEYSTVFDRQVFRAEERTVQPFLVWWFAIGIGLVCFLMARYAIGLARMKEYRLIRAGAAISTGTALVCAMAAVALMVGKYSATCEPLGMYVIRLMCLLIGIEFLGNFIADFYRPRIPGTIRRPAFDSRMLGLISEPGGIARSIADAINYQFGFEVSKTWFYQLLQSALLPLAALTVLVIVILTSVLMVDADEQAIIERFGRKVTVDGRVKVLDAGMHFKFPWPIDVARRAPVKRLSGMLIGEDLEAVRRKDETANDAILWTETHEFQAEMMLIVAATDLADLSIHARSLPGDPADGEGSPQAPDRSVAVSLAMASMPIEFRVRDVEKFLYNYANPPVLIESVANRVLTNNAAGIDLETLMGTGRQAFNEKLRADLQRELDALELGVELVFCGLQSVHPPAVEEVASTYQDVIAAEGGKNAAIHAAEGRAEAILTAVAGNRSRADGLYRAIQERQAIRERFSPESKEFAEAQKRVDDLLLGNPEAGIQPLSGTTAARIAEARASAARAISRERAKLAVFAGEVAAYEAAPGLYMQRKQLELYNELDRIRKYLIIGDSNKVIIEYENVEPTQIDLSSDG